MAALSMRAAMHSAVRSAALVMMSYMDTRRCASDVR